MIDIEIYYNVLSIERKKHEWKHLYSENQYKQMLNPIVHTVSTSHNEQGTHEVTVQSSINNNNN